MSTRPASIWSVLVASLGAMVACSGSDEPGGPTGSAGNAGQAGDAGGAPAGQGGSTGGSGQGGTSGGGGGATGQTCGVEVCSGTKQCCPSTGSCFDPSFEACGKITCTVTSNDTGGAAGAPNCCPMNLSHCAANNLCYHSACVGCCP